MHVCFQIANLLITGSLLKLGAYLIDEYDWHLQQIPPPRIIAEIIINGAVTAVADVTAD